MARIRTIKPSFWGDDKVSELSRDARLLFLGLVSMADDSGRFLGSPSAISGYIYPNDKIQPKWLAARLAELEQSGMVVFYNGGRIRYGAIPNWRKHQKISHPQRSTLPAPPDNGLFPE
jgi:hypothetical protein